MTACFTPGFPFSMDSIEGELHPGEVESVPSDVNLRPS